MAAAVVVSQRVPSSESETSFPPLADPQISAFCFGGNNGLKDLRNNSPFCLLKRSVFYSRLSRLHLVHMLLGS